MLKDGHAQKRNHQHFYDHLKSGDDPYLYWLVCDATQRLTLEKDGYSDFWWALYREATERNRDGNNYFAEFSAHRTALYSHPQFLRLRGNLDYAKENYERLLQKAADEPEYPFYCSIYLSQMAGFSEFDRDKLLYSCESFFCDLAIPETPRTCLIGEWKSFVTPFDRRKQANVAVNCAIHVFINNGELRIGKKLYNDACALGMRRNYYIDKRLQQVL